jgi:hypothetical protein
MSEDQPTVRITVLQPLMVVTAIAAGIVVGAIFLFLSTRTAGAATLPPLPSPISAATTTVGEVAVSAPATVVTTIGDVVSSTPAVVATTLSSPDPLATATEAAGSTVSQLVNGGSSVVASLAGPTNLSRGVAAPPISALSVLTSPAPLVLGDVVNQGPLTTPTPTRGPMSATTLLGVVSRTGSADLFSPVTSTRTGPVGQLRPLVPVPSPRRPSVPELPPVAAGASSAPGVHSGTLDALPPAVVVLALLAVGGVCLELRRRPKFRYDLRFSPPG